MPNVYEVITDNIVKLIDEQGTLPWRKPWTGAASRPRSARNIPYRGINVFILETTKMLRGYTSSFWMTYRQAEASGGNVKKGEKSTAITFWKVGQAVRDAETGKMRRPFMLRYYNVFNLAQTEGVKLTAAMKAEAEAIDNGLVFNPTLDDAEAILASYFVRDGAPVFTEVAGSNDAFYSPSLDIINTPARGQYTSPEDFYYTVFHEVGHSTGHESRLNRKSLDGFSHGSYGKEELVAEMTAAFLGGDAGIADHRDQSAAYLKSWLTAIKADTQLLIKAASEAQKAADLILGTTFDKESEE